MSNGVGLVPVGLAVTWAGYTLGIWGYCLVRGYNVTFADCFKGSWPGTGKAAAPSSAGSSPGSSSGSAAGGTPVFTRPGSPTGQSQNSVGSRL